MAKKEVLPQQNAAISARDLVALMDRVGALLTSSGIVIETIKPELKSDGAKKAFDILKRNLEDVERYYRGE